MSDDKAIEIGLGPWRWTLSEYVLRCEDGVDVRELLVEGEIDRDVFSDAVVRWKADVCVLDGDYLDVSTDQIVAAGYTPGVKGALLTVATALDVALEGARLRAFVAVIVDRDYDDELFQAASRTLLVTDGHSIESYAFSPSALGRFLTVALGRVALPTGAKGATPSRRTTTTGQDVYDRVRQAAAQMAAVRMVVHELTDPPAIFERWLDYVKVSSDGVLDMNGEKLLKAVLSAARREEEYLLVEAQLRENFERADSDPSRWVRGHDFVEMMMKLCRSRWGRQIAGVHGRMTERAFARQLLLSVDPTELDATPLFAELQRRVKTAVS